MSEDPPDLTTPATGGAECDERDSLSGRVLTFDHRWSGTVDKTQLATAEFAYTGIGDKVECDQCGLKLLNWIPTDDPLHEHATRRPLCPFINSRYRQLGQTKPPKHPKYQELQERLDSFVAWPGRYVPKTPEDLAAAGFFYIGSADRVTCFQCGITLRDWEEEHDPVEEHRRYSENCQFINKTNLTQLGVAARIAKGYDSHSSTEQSSDKVECACAMATASNYEHTSTHALEKTIMTSCLATETVDTNTLQTKSSLQSTSTSPTTTLLKTEIETTTYGRRGSGVGRLAEENRRLKQKGTCRVCREKGVAVLFLPCGHLVTCSDCAPNVKDCVVCEKNILGTVKTFFHIKSQR